MQKMIGQPYLKRQLFTWADQYKQKALELIWKHTHTQESGVQVQTKSVVETTAARYCSWFVVWNFLLDEIPLEKGCSLSLFYPLVLVLLQKSFICQRLWCLGLVVCLWLSENIVILSMFKQVQQPNRLWAHTIFKIV